MPHVRFIDSPPYSFEYCHVLKTKGIWVKCNKCNQAAVLKEVEEQVFLKCYNCSKNKKIEYHANKSYEFIYTGLCQACGKYIKYKLETIPYPMLTKKCSNCQMKNKLNLQKTKSVLYSYKEERFLYNGRDPISGSDLYFKDSFRGSVFWALNPNHLDYLISYVEADIRERDVTSKVWRTAGHNIPKFMKIAKNKNNILRKLKKMKDLSKGKEESEWAVNK